jgi:putative iron-regulated protein
VLSLALAIGAVACGDDASDDGTAATSYALGEDQALDAATAYADLVHTSYSDTLGAADEMRSAVQAFVAGPTEETLRAARDQWLAARDLYGQTEAYRFYDGPIDDPEDGPEGRINAWPMDEAYVDYVADDPAAGIVNDTDGVPEITTDVLVSANEEGGEANISTGWHAIEFLLWGQDLVEGTPGNRPVTDYTTASNAERRARYLTLVTDLLVEDLEGLVAQWEPEGGAYREEFLADPQEAVSDILRGMGALSTGELAGERIAVAYETEDQEDEHSCFSDNTMADVIANATGIRNAYTAQWPGVEGTSLHDVVAEVEPGRDAALMESLDATVAAAESLAEMGTFEQVIQGGDDSEGRAAMLALVDSLQAQGDLIAELGSALGYEISLEV